MTPKEFIENRLEKVKEVPVISCGYDTKDIQAEILRLLLSKKFRKYSANESLIAHCKNAIAVRVEKNEPINITFVHGGYKLWRLKESPYVDWAELFALMYYTNWVKSICAVYEPGVHFDFFVDDWIVPILNNVSEDDVNSYIGSYRELLSFLKSYQPKNLDMTITPVGSCFESRASFDEMLASEMTKLDGEGLADLDEAHRAMVELNVKVTPEQEADPLWREKVWQIHRAYMPVKASPKYHKCEDKIVAFTQPLSSGTTISVGTTKSSIMKFWVGAGALKSKGDSFIEIILSPSRLELTDFDVEELSIGGLTGKNFGSIRVLRS